MISSPGIPTDKGTIDNHQPEVVVQLETTLRHMEVYDYTPHTRRTARYGTVEPVYNLGYQRTIPSFVQHLPVHYEAPDMQRSPRAYSAGVLRSMSPQKQVGSRLSQSFRAPAINEGT